MFCRIALPKIRTLTADDEVILCSWQRVRPPTLLYLTCNVTFTVDILTTASKPLRRVLYVLYSCSSLDAVLTMVTSCKTTVCLFTSLAYAACTKSYCLATETSVTVQRLGLNWPTSNRKCNATTTRTRQ